MYEKRVKYINQDSIRKNNYCNSGIAIFFGALLVAVSLELFLVKNHLLDGGIIGICIILSYLTGLKIGYLILLLNVPFLFIAYRFIGRNFVLLSLFALLILSACTSLLTSAPALTGNPFLFILLGGIMLGSGVGIIIRFGGSLDGTEILAILLSRHTQFTIGQYVMFFNTFIFGSSFFIFGLKEAVYSLATYYIAFKTIDLILKN
ncbi:MAG TPA: YitT family protein [Chondromyces sp.]|nr:YitT family protein [Chondromyces sp.]